MVAIDQPTAAVVIYGDNQNTILSLLDVFSCNMFTLDTKYYSASIQAILCKYTETPSTGLPINGVILNCNLTEAQTVTTTDAFRESDVRLFCTRTSPTNELHEWAIINQVEIVDLVDEPERVLEAMESSIWPGASMKTGNHFMSSAFPEVDRTPDDAPSRDERPDLVSENELHDLMDDDEDLQAVFAMVQQARSAGRGMSDIERRANAESVISAISTMLGDDLLLDDE